jgi:transcriptional regulator with XRE-family HTH domain
MSDIYLVLRHRLEELTNWVTLGAEVMKGARNALGLSYEAVARQVPISAKTYERWEKRGAVPAPSVDRIAEILRLEIERPKRTSVTVENDEESLDEIRRELSVEVARLRKLNDQAEARLTGPAKPRRVRKPVEPSQESSPARPARS